MPKTAKIAIYSTAACKPTPFCIYPYFYGLICISQNSEEFLSGFLGKSQMRSSLLPNLQKYPRSSRLFWAFLATVSNPDKLGEFLNWLNSRKSLSLKEMSLLGREEMVKRMRWWSHQFAMMDAQLYWYLLGFARSHRTLIPFMEWIALNRLQTHAAAHWNT